MQGMCRQRSALATQLWLLLSCCGQMMVLKGISANSSSSQIEEDSWSRRAQCYCRRGWWLSGAVTNTQVKGPAGGRGAAHLRHLWGPSGAGPCVGSALRHGQEPWEPRPCQGSRAAAEGEQLLLRAPALPSGSASLGCKRVLLRRVLGVEGMLGLACHGGFGRPLPAAKRRPVVCACPCTGGEPALPPEQHRGRGQRHVPALHQPRHRVPVRGGHPGQETPAPHRARPQAHVQGEPTPCPPLVVCTCFSAALWPVGGNGECGGFCSSRHVSEGAVSVLCLCFVAVFELSAVWGWAWTLGQKDG